MPSRLIPSSARKRRSSCHLCPLVMRQLSFRASIGPSAAVDDEIGHEGETQREDNAGDDQRDEAEGDGDDRQDVRAEKAPERLRVPQIGDLHALNVVVRAQREGRQAEADEDRRRRCWRATMMASSVVMRLRDDLAVGPDLPDAVRARLGMPAMTIASTNAPMRIHGRCLNVSHPKRMQSPTDNVCMSHPLFETSCRNTQVIKRASRRRRGGRSE